MAIVLEPRIGELPQLMGAGPKIKRWLRDRNVDISRGMAQAIDSVTRECAVQLADIADRGTAVQHQEQIEDCNVWLSDAIVAHLTFGDRLKVHDVDPLDVLGIKPPNADWLQYIADVPPTVAEALNACMESEVCRLSYRKLAGAAVLGIVDLLTNDAEELQDKLDWSMLRRSARGVGPAYWNIRTIYEVHKLLKDLAYLGANIWGDFVERKNEPTQRRVASRSNKYIWQEQESYMPYNRRTGQWYPSRRRYGNTYNRGYRRYNRYNRGWAPRRRRSYSRW